MMEKNAKIYVAGHRGMVGSAIVRELEKQGYQVVACMDGQKVLNTVLTEKPDLILLDVRMPGMDGGEMLKLIRENPETADTNVLIASAHLSESLKHDLEKMEPDGILEKPVHLAKLIASVQKLVDLQIV